MDPRLMIGPKSPTLTGIKIGKTQNKQNTSGIANKFQNLLFDALNNSNAGSLKISAHAQKRLSERKISIDENLENSLKEAMDELSEKGAKDSLVITREGAFILNIPNRTMVTAMGIGEMRDGIVTNIDSVSMKYQ